MTQLQFFIKDVGRILGNRYYRLLYIWLNRNFIGVLLYRLERSLYLIFGRFYGVLRLILLPLFKILQAYSNIDIHYAAEIKGGLIILHPSIGCVISKYCTIGENLTLTGGNVIGIKSKYKTGDFRIGDNCTLGANSTIIGPLLLGKDVVIGASSCVVKSYPDNGLILIGVPARPIEKSFKKN